jgi:hypothetical protein
LSRASIMPQPQRRRPGSIPMIRTERVMAFLVESVPNHTKSKVNKWATKLTFHAGLLQILTNGATLR